MARELTRRKVHQAVLLLARERPVATITMEGVAARAGVSKQTLYRSWPSTGAIFFDALMGRSANSDGDVDVPDTGELAADLQALAVATIAELTDPTHEQLLRAVTAQLQSDSALAEQFRELLLIPQMQAITDRLSRGGVSAPHDVAELFVGPIFHRWLLGTRPFDPDWVASHVARTLRAGGVG